MRSILCPDCSKSFALHPSDAADGWHMRKVEIKVKVPTDGSHRITVMAGDKVVSDTPVPIIVCDHCNDEIPEGQPGICVSMWQGTDELEDWERKYGNSTNQAGSSPDQEAG